MFGCYFQSAAHVLHNQFAGVFGIGFVGFWIACVVQQEVVAHTAADEALLDARECINGAIDVE